MSTFLSLYTAVTDSLGRDDTLAVTQAKRGINFGQILAALVFDPIELKTSGNLTISASGTSVIITTLTSIRLINSIYNTTGSKDVKFIPEDKFNLIVPSDLTYVEYFYRHGSYIYVNPPTDANTLNVKYNKFPTELTNDSDVLEITNNDSFIIAAANSYAFASFEEAEASKLWDTALQTFTVPFTINAKKLTEFKEALKASGHDI